MENKDTENLNDVTNQYTNTVEQNDSEVSEGDISSLREKLKSHGLKLKDKFSKVRDKIEVSGETTNKQLSKTGNSSVAKRLEIKGAKSKQQTEVKNLVASEEIVENKKQSTSSTNRGKNRTRIFSQSSGSSQNHLTPIEKNEKIKNIRDKLQKFVRTDQSDNYLRYTRFGFHNFTRSRTNSDKSIHSSTSGNLNDKSNLNQKNVLSNAKRIRTNSERVDNTENYCKSIRSNSLNDPNGENNSKSNTESKKTRRRNRRKSKIANAVIAEKEQHVPFYAQKTENLHINSETLLILDLLKMPAEQHEEFLLDLAKTKKILVENALTKRFEWSPEITKFNSILLLGKYQRTFTAGEARRLEGIANASNSSKSSNRKSDVNLNNDMGLKILSKTEIREPRREEKKIRVFEDYINAIVGEDLDEEMKREYEFPAIPRRQRVINYFCKEDFERKLEKFAQKCVTAGLGIIIEGDIRVNAKNNDQAFIKNVDGERDAFLCSQLIRKNALHGDIVRVFVKKVNITKLNTPVQNQIANIEIDEHDEINKISEKNLVSKLNNEEDYSFDEMNEKSDDKLNVSTTEEGTSYDENEKQIDNLNINLNDKSIDPIEDIIDVADISADGILNIEDEPVIPEKSSKAFVIRIVQEIHNRRCVGSFLSYRKDSEYITFIPRDMKMPHLRIYRHDWPLGVRNKLNNIGDDLYIAEITFWKNEICYGKILNPMGKCGHLESENKAILTQNNLNVDPYDEKFFEMFNTPLEITEKDIEARDDLRSECIFTIDPLTARDLDDAMSCKKLNNGLYEIGVHISDVSHFLEEGCELDELVKLRTTSIYMVNEVFHMLPKSLCMKCSLLPGEDKFAFSVFWLINENAQCVETTFKRTIIKSCTQFAYEHAQKIIDYPNEEFQSHDFPEIHNGYNIDDIIEKIKILHHLAEKMREHRFNNGALKINKPKLSFDLHPETGEPSAYSTIELNTANFLIEEFMLLANQSVADFIYHKFPEISILRSHDPPLKNVMQKVKDKLDKQGLTLNVASSKSIHNSLINLIQTSNSPEATEIILSHMVSKPMTRARYLCSANITDKQHFWHYALCIPIYTHFTSPIRRYPDLLVHRVLSAALGFSDPPSRSSDELDVIAAICNEKKHAAKLAGEDSFNLYFMYYIKSQKLIKMRAAVNDFFSNSFEVILIETGHIIRIAYPRGNKTGDSKMVNDDTVQPRRAILKYLYNTPHEEIKILKIFDEIDVEVYVEKLKIKARIPLKIPPNNLDDNELSKDINMDKLYLEEYPTNSKNQENLQHI